MCQRCAKAFEGEAMEQCPEDGGMLLRVSGDEDRAGQLIDGKFTILDELGKGGMGSVYRALQHSMEREVAVKVLKRSFAEDVSAVQRFLQEAKGASKLNHPNIITLFNFGQSSDGELYLMMELLEGKPLSDLIAEEAPLSAHRSVQIAAQICDALHYAHEAGVVHRDMKPDNVFVLEGGRGDFVKVLDFGIAKMQSVDGAESITRTGMVCGTPTYMSPEQAQGKTVDGRSDVYSIAVVIYELLSGTRPFTGETPIQMLIAHVNQEPTPIRETAGIEVPHAVERVVMRGLAKDPDLRPQTAKDFGDQLIAALREHERRPSTVELSAVDTSRGVSSPLLEMAHEETELSSPALGTDETATVDSVTSAPALDSKAAHEEVTLVPQETAPASATVEAAQAAGVGGRSKLPLAVAAALVLAIGGWAAFGGDSPDEAKTKKPAAESEVAAKVEPGAKPSPPAVKPKVAPAPSPVVAKKPAAPPARPAAQAPPPPTRTPEAEAPTPRAAPAPPEVKPEVVAAKPEPAQFEVTSKPAGATIYVNGEKLGAAPVKVTQTPGTKMRIVAKRGGYRTASKTVAGERAEPLRLKLAKKKPKTGVGSLIAR